MGEQTRRKRKISEELLDELLAGQDAAEVFRSGALVDDPRRRSPSGRWTRRWRRISSARRSGTPTTTATATTASGC